MPPSRSHLLLALAVLAAIPLFAWADSFVTAKGQTVEMPDISTMSCEQIEGTLAKIDSTRYRENAPHPHDRADEPLHRYEKTLAKALYKVCVTDRRSAVGRNEALREQAGRQ